MEGKGGAFNVSHHFSRGGRSGRAWELATLLTRYGYSCLTTDDFSDVAGQILSSGAHLVLLDLNLPLYDGYHVCRALRERSQIPVIVVTSRTGDLDELMSMNLGADDFLTKPFHTQILLARILPPSSASLSLCVGPCPHLPGTDTGPGAQ